jgi:hypothetical protein
MKFRDRQMLHFFISCILIWWRVSSLGHLETDPPVTFLPDIAALRACGFLGHREPVNNSPTATRPIKWAQRRARARAARQ